LRETASCEPPCVKISSAIFAVGDDNNKQGKEKKGKEREGKGRNGTKSHKIVIIIIIIASCTMRYISRIYLEALAVNRF